MREALDGKPCIVPEWPAPERVRAFVTTRACGTGEVARYLPSQPLWLKQVHGVDVVEADSWKDSTPPTADAAIARTPGRVCVAFTADCLPLFVCDASGEEVAVAHAGWRGLAAGVVENTVARFGSEPRTLMAWMGPAIGPQVFEVGPEVRDAFTKVDALAAEAFAPHREGKFLGDLYRLARQRLARAGVEQVFGGGFCTYTDAERFFSYRREKAGCGRMGAFIWRQ